MSAQRFAEAAREHRRVLVLGRHDRPESADGSEVARRGQGHQRAAPAVRGVGDGPLLAFRQPGQARVLAAPGLLGIADRPPARSRGSGSKRPAGLAIGAARDVELGDAAEILDANEEDRLVADARGARVEDAVGRVGDVGCGQDRVARGPLEQRTGARVTAGATRGRSASRWRRHEPWRRHERRTARRPTAGATRGWRPRIARMCSAAMSHISVDSAPSFVVDAVGFEPVRAGAPDRMGDPHADVVRAQEPAVRALHRDEVLRVAGDVVARLRRRGAARSPRSAAGRTWTSRRSVATSRCRWARSGPGAPSGRR